MKYSMKGTIKINLDDVFTTDAESKTEAIEQIIERMVENGVFGRYLDDSELTEKGIKKTFKVTVTETFTNTVEIDTDEYPEILDETDARRYVENNLDDFNDDFDYTYYSRDDIETMCYMSDTEEEEINIDE